MLFKQFYLGCLAQASYLIGSRGEAAVVDPRRDVDEYLDEARREGLTIRYVLETHLHADFVSGHRELSERTGAEVVFGSAAGAGSGYRPVKDGDVLRVGAVRLRILETPGHTPESISIVVTDEDEGLEPSLVLTGDTLFIGDVGRPDLVGARGRSAEEMASLLYDSLHRKLLALPDDVRVYPAHGAGSLCGKNISKETWSSIGEQRRSNYALRPMPRRDFVRMTTVDLPEAPSYFADSVEKNRAGAPALAASPGPQALEPEAFATMAKAGALGLDVREAADFAAGHVLGSLNLGLRGQFAPWAGALLNEAFAILLVTDEGAGEALTRLARVGIETVVGHLEGGAEAWQRSGRPLATLPQITVSELHDWLAGERRETLVVDVRRAGEWRAGHVPGAVHLPLERVATGADHLPRGRPTAVVCAGGYRSSAAASLLLRAGFDDLYNVVGGTAAWVAAGFPRSGPLDASSEGAVDGNEILRPQAEGGQPLPRRRNQLARREIEEADGEHGFAADVAGVVEDVLLELPHLARIRLDPGPDLDALPVSELPLEPESGLQDHGSDLEAMDFVETVAVVGDEVPARLLQDLQVGGVVHVAERVEVLLLDQQVVVVGLA